MNTWKLDMAGLAVEIRFPQFLVMVNAEQFQSFRSAASKKNIRVHVHLIRNSKLTGRRLDLESHPLLSKAGRRGTSSPLLRSGKIRGRLAEAALHGDQLFIEILPESLTILDFKSNRADFYFRSGSRSGPERKRIGSAMLAPFLPNFDACMLHASAIVRQGRAAVFLAPDEGGKTTAVRLSPSGAILGDDQVIVRRFQGGFLVSGTPWGLHFDGRAQAPLGGLFMLEKADHFSLAPLTAHELVPRIWEEIKNPLSILPRPLKKKAFAFLCEIAAAVPAYRLSFAGEHIDWPVIDRAMPAF
jgi:hypothetical protein